MYALLTNIQGFDSFSLGPSSSPEEIARAFQTQARARALTRARKNNASLTRRCGCGRGATQTLIWHPDKNPGDAQAQRVYDRMLHAYNLLMDPAQRISPLSDSRH